MAFMTREELLAKLEAYYLPRVSLRRQQEGDARGLAEQLEQAWDERRRKVNDYFDAQESAAKAAATVAALDADVKAIEAS